MRRLTATVTGFVQGVSYRYYTRREANRLGVKGWVKNESDGSVRVVAEGSEEQLRGLLNFLRRGSPSAQVADVSLDWSTASGDFNSFEVRF
jgi:acylphosphatase